MLRENEEWIARWTWDRNREPYDVEINKLEMQNQERCGLYPEVNRNPNAFLILKNKYFLTF